MPRRRSIAAPGMLSLAIALCGPGLASVARGAQQESSGSSASPAARLHARIATLHAEVDSLSLERKALKAQYLECRKRYGTLSSRDHGQAQEEVKNEVGRLLAMLSEIGPEKLQEELRRQMKQRGAVIPQDAMEDLAAVLKAGASPSLVRQRLVELTIADRVRVAADEFDRQSRNYFKTCQRLYEKKLELSDAEAELKASR